MWVVTNNIDSHPMDWELIMFINVKVLRLRSTNWKSSLMTTFLLFPFDCSLLAFLGPLKYKNQQKKNNNSENNTAWISEKFPVMNLNSII